MAAVKTRLATDPTAMLRKIPVDTNRDRISLHGNESTTNI